MCLRLLSDRYEHTYTNGIQGPLSKGDAEGWNLFLMMHSIFHTFFTAFIPWYFHDIFGQFNYNINNMNAP